MTKKRGNGGFTAEERSAMKERAAELGRGRRRGGEDEDGERDVLAKIAEMREPERTMATRVHAIIRENAPHLVPRTWYGMPAYANREGNVVCHFQSAEKFKMRYSTLGFSDKSGLDEGEMWPVAFAVRSLNKAVEAQITALIRKASG